MDAWIVVLIVVGAVIVIGLVLLGGRRMRERQVEPSSESGAGGASPVASATG